MISSRKSSTESPTCIQSLRSLLEAEVKSCLDAHSRVRQASKAKGVKHRIEAQDLPDILGVFVYLPKV